MYRYARVSVWYGRVVTVAVAVAMTMISLITKQLYFILINYCASSRLDTIASIRKFICISKIWSVHPT